MQCSAPPRSSHTLKLLRPVLVRAEIAKRLVRTPLVVPADPSPHGAARLHEARKSMLPDALLFQAAEEALYDPVLFWGVGRDELLAEAVVPARRPKPPTLKDESVVRSHD